MFCSVLIRNIRIFSPGKWRKWTLTVKFIISFSYQVPSQDRSNNLYPTGILDRKRVNTVQWGKDL